MRWLRLKGSYPVGASQDEYETIHCRSGVREFATPDGELYQAMYIETAIQLEPEDIAALMAGGVLILTQLGRQWAPLSVTLAPKSELHGDGSS